MSLPSIFSTPINSQKSIRLQTGTLAEVTRKRKRTGLDALPQFEPPIENSSGSDSNRALPTEYTAVVTPTERSQRRLAGLSLDQEPPNPPFPHAREPDGDDRKVKGHREDVQTSQAKISLHSQHIAAMMAVLHRSVMTRDYVRAGRAIGLLLRNEVGGQAIDIRKGGLWGIGAEVLLRHNSRQQESNVIAEHRQSSVTREGFERTKLYYERLIVQYPPHKTWPDAVNARDFCIALFGLWIYVTNQESLQIQSESNDDNSSSDGSSISLLDAKRWELLQARQIADAMDLRMRDAPFNGERELIRLRAMVALWTADLLDKCVQLEEDDESMRKLQEPPNEDTFTDHIERVAVDVRPTAISASSGTEAMAHRALAESLSRKLQETTHNDFDDDGC